MTTPISNANSSFYDPSAQYSAADACDAATASCAASARQPSSVPAEVTHPPIMISGDAGAQQLVKDLDTARRSPDCSLEAKNAALSCAKAGALGMATALSSATVVAALPGLAATVFESISCGKDLRAYYECENP